MHPSRLALSALALIAAFLAVALSSEAPAQGADGSGTLVFLRDSDPPGSGSTLQRLAPGAKSPREVFAARESVFDIDVSPDGKQIAYVTLGRPGDQIRIVGTNGKGDRGLVSGSNIIDNVSWTPDGSQLIYSAGPFDGRGNRQLKRSEIYSVAVSGGEPERLTRDDFADFDPTVTPDGERIVYSRSPEVPTGVTEPELDLFSMALDGSDVQQLTDTKFDEQSPDVSPDGKRIAFVKRRVKDSRRRLSVQVAGIDGSDSVTVERGAGNDRAPAWTPDGKRIVFTSDRADRKATDGYFREQLYTAKPDGTRVKQLLESSFGDSVASYVP